MRSSQRPSARLTAGRVLMAPWFPQCCTVSPIHAPASPVRSKVCSVHAAPKLVRQLKCQAAKNTRRDLPTPRI